MTFSASRRLTTVAATSLFSAGLLVVGVPAVRAEPSTGPVLWEGDAQHPNGDPAAAQVVAFIRPPADALLPGAPLVPLAAADTDGSGHFQLRALPSPAFSAVADSAGWVTLLLATFGANDTRIAVDSVAWDKTNGRWVSHPAALAGGTPDPASLVDERPAAVTLSGSDRVPDGTHPKGVGSCWMEGKTELDKEFVHVGELHLNRDWGGQFVYTNTKTTSWQVGISHNGGPFEVGGSVSFAKQVKSGQRKHPIPAEVTERIFNYDAQMRVARYEWNCNRGYPNRYHASTVEAVEWTTGMRERRTGPIPTCTHRDYKVPAVPEGDYFREDGSSTTLEGAIKIGTLFSGSVTTANSEVTSYTWSNPLPRERTMCGMSNYPDRNTRMASLP